MTSPLPTTIPNTRIQAGDHTIGGLPTTTAVFREAEILINRNITGGLNSLTSADTLTVGIQFSLDGGTTWKEIASQTFQGGVITYGKGGTDDQAGFGFSADQPFPIGTQFQVHTIASAAVRITGTVTYNP